MEFAARRILGFLMLGIGIVMFMVEFKALPHKPKDPEKWDQLHAKYFRQIKMSARVFILLGLTFMIATPQG